MKQQFSFIVPNVKKLTDVEIEAQLPVVPQGYTEKTCSITITGICKACNNSDEEQ
ncbi:MAG: hypothetical protein H6Q14_2661 [Bacteroidetes bacterium]|nr:hypothetical protein [Bacteroidota bacterium]MBP1618834.1 hypothetical protein [Bacteroidota bacterium]